MSREELAEGICTSKQIYRIEKGLSEPSIFILNQLSMKFNLDLNEYYKMHFINHSLSALEGIIAINSAINSGDMQQLKALIKIYEKHPDFKSGENLQYIYYSKALYTALLDKDNKASLEYCYKGLRVECPSFTLDNITENIYSNMGISILNCVSLNFFTMNDCKRGMIILKKLLVKLENAISNSSFSLIHGTEFLTKTYSAILYNMGFFLFQEGKLEDALIYFEKGISHCVNEYSIRYLPDLLYMKFEILYLQKKYREAREYYDYAYSLYKLDNNIKELTNMEQLLKTEFTEINHL